MLAESLQSVEHFGLAEVSSVVIVDNGSIDGSLKFLELRDTASLPVQIVRNTVNRGFAAACNQGAALVEDAIVLFLNPDTRLFADSISVPMKFVSLPENSKVGIVGIRLVDEHGKTARSCARFPGPRMFFLEALGLTRIKPFRHLGVQMTDWAHDSIADVDHVIGAFYMIRRTLFEQLGGFDERFFVYLEDLDLSLRARQAGWRSAYLASASAYHAGGGTSRQVKARRLFYSLRSKLLYGFKHFSNFDAIVVTVAVLMIEPVTRTGFAIARGKLEELRHIAHAYWLLFRDLPALLTRRHRT